MPKISAPTVVEHREQRRAALLEAAAALILREGTFTVAEVATEVGLSRSAVYEYYGSAAELIADVLVDELAAWNTELVDATAGLTDPQERIRAWVRAVLEYVADGRHALVRAAGTIELPANRRTAVQEQHRDLIRPLAAAVTDARVSDPAAAASLVWGAVDASITRIEAGSASAAQETDLVLTFIRGGLEALSD